MSDASNDLYRVACDSLGVALARYDSALEAVNAAQPGDGVLILADGYPEATTSVSDEVLAIAAENRLRLYIEFPSDGVAGCSFEAPSTNGLKRLVVMHDDDLAGLGQFTILDSHEGVYVTAGDRVAPGKVRLSLARVAGYDSAAFGLTGGAAPEPALFMQRVPGTEAEVMVATTALSQFVRGRYAPNIHWEKLWEGILSELSGGDTAVDLAWQPLAHPAYADGEPLARGARRDAVAQGIQWYDNVRLLIHPDWQDVYEARNPFPDHRIHQPWIGREFVAGDGSLGVLEGTANPMYPDGTQALRWYIRADVVAPSAMAFALHHRLDGDAHSATVAKNLVGFLSTSRLGDGHRADPESITYGLRGWNASLHYNDVFYSDDIARVQLGQIVAAAALDTDAYDELLATQILSVFRLTGTNGFWHHDRIDGTLPGRDWREFHNATPDPAARVHPHFEAYKLANFLWLYDKTGHAPLLERSRTALGHMVTALKEGRIRWTNGVQQERARLVLPLAWLVRVDDTPEHRAWLAYVVDEILDNQQACGGIIEEVGGSGGYFPPPNSNDAFGTSEAPVIQANGDPGVDLLYTTNFAFKGLIEAAGVMDDPRVTDAVQRLGDFLVRIQIESEMPELDGQWIRGFDFEKWDYWGSDSDLGWGIWGGQAGWTQAEIVSGLALLEMETTAWDLTAQSRVDRVFMPVLAHMFELEFDAMDLNFDGAVNAEDRRDVIEANLGQDVSRYSAIVRPALGDVNRDGRVDEHDLAAFDSVSR
ncbi:MAG: hypothetical protein ACIAXF_12295 [Phycisphaerales bacterium JB063]